ncbi:hypothetical protein EVAR_42606_1 [Eumeta japonica]|uniref:Uncharacterized protein n=1 Tax=Eumeta variegata TaxID=151549 RepID=A0A4C1XR31_EUMVA|nr:hypothetical protein EVAR_42606_1 [Eumeta japonica]
MSSSQNFHTEVAGAMWNRVAQDRSEWKRTRDTYNTKSPKPGRAGATSPRPTRGAPLPQVCQFFSSSAPGRDHAHGSRLLARRNPLLLLELSSARSFLLKQHGLARSNFGGPTHLLFVKDNNFPISAHYSTLGAAISKKPLKRLISSYSDIHKCVAKGDLSIIRNHSRYPNKAGFQRCVGLRMNFKITSTGGVLM